MGPRQGLRVHPGGRSGSVHCRVAGIETLLTLGNFISRICAMTLRAIHSEEPARLHRVCLGNTGPERNDDEDTVCRRICRELGRCLRADTTAPQHENPALQSTTRSPAATLPETKTVAPDATGAPIEQQTTGQAPNVSKKMGAEMESAGDRRASPDQQ